MTFTEAVDVTGTPTLTLQVGANSREAAYASGSGTATLVFSYTVAAGDADADGVSVPANPIVVPTGASIGDSAGSAVLAYGGRAADASRKVDAVAPTRSGSIAFNKSNGTARSGDELRFTVTFSEPVHVTGTPTVNLRFIKGQITNHRKAGYAGRTGARELVFSYSVVLGDSGDNVVFSLSGLADGSIVDAVGNSFVSAGGSGSWSVTVDGTQQGTDDVGPLVKSLALSSTATRDADNDGTNDTYRVGDDIDVSVTFSEAVTANTTDGTPSLALQVGTGAAKAASYASGSGMKTLVFRYAVAAADTDMDGVSVAAGSIALNGGTLKDAAGNDAALAHDPLAPNALHKVDGTLPPADTTLPTLSSAAINGAALTLTFSEALDPGSVPAALQFGATIGTLSVRGTAIEIDGATVTVTMSTGARHGQAAELNFTNPGSNPLRDLSGNLVEDFLRQSVTNNTPPAFSSATVSGAALSVNFDGPLDEAAGSKPAAADFAVTVGGEAAALAATDPVEVSGAKVTLTLAEAVGGSLVAVTVGYTPGTNALKDSDNAKLPVAGFSGRTVTNNTVDTTLPTLSSAAINGAALTLTFSEALDPGSVPAALQFGATIGTLSVRGTAIEIDGATVTVTMSTGARHGQAAELNFTNPGSNPLRDLSGNLVEDFLRQSVTNNTPPAFSSATVSGAALSVNFDGPLDEAAGSKPAAADFAVTVGGEAAALAATDPVEVSGAKVTLTLAEAVGGSLVAVTVGYTPGTNALKDSDNAKLPVAGFSGRTVTNNTVDTTLPTLSSAAINGAALTLTFSEALDPGSVPAALQFGATIGTLSVRGTAIEIDGATVTVTMSTGARHGQAAELNFTNPGSNPLRDLSGNLVEDFLRQSVTNNTPPAFSSATVSGAALSVNFDGPLDEAAGSKPAAADFAVTVGGEAAALAATDPVEVSGAKVTLTLAEAVGGSLVAVTVGYTPGTNALKDSDNAKLPVAGFSGRTVTNNTVDTTLPTLSSAAINGAALTLTFSEALDPGSVPAALQFGATIGTLSVRGTAIEIDGATVTVTMSTGARHGQAAELNFTNPGSNPLRDLSGNLVEDFLRQSVTNNTPPAFSSATVSGAALSVNFDGPLDEAAGSKPAAADFAVTVGGEAAALAATDPVEVSGAKVTLTLAEAVGGSLVAVTVGYTPGTNALKDSDNAKLPVAGFSGRTVTNNTVDTTLPTLSSAAINGAALTLTFSEALDPGSVPAALQFGATIGTLSVRGTAIEIDGATVTVTMSTGARHGQAAELNFTNPGSNPLRDLSGNLVEDFLRQSVTNNTPPAFSSATVSGAALSVNFDGPLDEAAGSKPAAADFAVTVGGEAAALAATDPVEVSGAKVTLTLAEAVGGSLVAVTVGYTPGTNALKDSDNAKLPVAGFSGRTVTNNTVDTTLPTLSSAAINGAALTLTFSEALDPGSVPAALQFGATIGTLSVRGTAIEIDGATVTVTMSTGARHGQAAELNFTNPGSNPLRDLSGNLVEDFLRQSVTNNTPPAFSSATVNGDQLTVSFNGGLDTGSVPDAGDFTVTVDGDTVALADTNPVEVAGSAATLTLAAAVFRSQAVTVGYTPGTNPLRDGDNAKNPVTGFSDVKSVTNNSNSKPRALWKGGTGANVCAVLSDPETTLKPNARLRTSAGQLVALVLVTREGETTEWPASCTSGSNKSAPVFDDPDGDALTIAIAEGGVADLPDNVREFSSESFDYPLLAAGGKLLQFSGVAALRQTNHDMKLSATDPHGASVKRTVRIIVGSFEDANGKPDFDGTVSDRHLAPNAEMTALVLPEATGGDPAFTSGTNTATFGYYYAVSRLPNGLTFTPPDPDVATSKPTISGTPTEEGTFTVTYTADDADRSGSAYLETDVADESDAARMTFTMCVGACGPKAEMVRIVSAPTYDSDNDGKRDTFVRGDEIFVDVEFGRAVKIDGDANNVTLHLDLGPDDTTLTNSQKVLRGPRLLHGGMTLRFAYTVGGGNGAACTEAGTTADCDTDGVWVQTDGSNAVVITTADGGTTASVVDSDTDAAADLTMSGLRTSGRTDPDGDVVEKVDGGKTRADTGPVPASATVDGATLTVTYNRALDASTVSTTALAPLFNVAGAGLNGGNRNAYQHPSAVSIGDSNDMLKLKLTNPARVADTVTLSYQLVGHKGPLKGAGGKMAPAFVDLAVTNETGELSPWRASVAGTTLRVVFDGALDATSAPAGAAFLVETSDDDQLIRRRSIRGTGTAMVEGMEVTVQLAEAVRADEAALVSYAKPGSEPLQSTGGIAVRSFERFRVETVRDVTAPVLVSLAAAEKASSPKAVLYFDEPLDETSVPASGDFAVTVDGAAATASPIAVNGNAVELTLSVAVAAGDAVAVSYTLGENPIRDGSGNPAAAFEETATAAGSGTPAFLAAHVVGSRVRLSFDRPLDPDGVPDTGAFQLHHVLDSGETEDDRRTINRRIRSVLVQGKKVVVRLDDAWFPCSGATPFAVSYTKPTEAGEPKIMGIDETEADGFGFESTSNERAHLCGTDWLDSANYGSVVLRARRPFATAEAPEAGWFTVTASGGPVAVTGGGLLPGRRARAEADAEPRVRAGRDGDGELQPPAARARTVERGRQAACGLHERAGDEAGRPGRRRRPGWRWCRTRAATRPTGSARRSRSR